MPKTKKRRILTALLIFALLFVVYFAAGYIRSLYLESTLIEVALPARGSAAGTVRVAQVSDLHLAEFGEANQALVDLIASKNPDIILATGDMIDVRAERIDDTVDLFQRLARLAPTVYSLGNHEMERDDLYDLMVALGKVGVHVVHNSAVSLHVHGMELRVGGLYRAEYLYELDDDGRIDILLCHFPDKLAVFAEYGVPLTFCGHTHGGQFRIPFFDIPLYAPSQGVFPQYTSGLYEMDNSYMIVSRGLGNSSFPFRIYNPPEVIIADITYMRTVTE